jgi:TRAP-type C4-dicarboxylate transport system permease small subunit
MLFSHALERLARLCSILGGLLMTGLMLMTCYSLIGRNVFDTALIGDFELTGIGSGAAVDFFTANRSAAFNFKLDRFGDFLMLIIFVLLAWRCGAAAINARETEGASMLLGFPDWIVFTSMCIPFSLTAFIAAMQTVSRFNPEAEVTA